MENIQPRPKVQNNFHLEKWFLDCVTEEGQAIIFYAAKLKWKKWTVPYTSWLYYNTKSGLSNKSRFRNVTFPEIKNDIIYWNDNDFQVLGTWKQLSPPINDIIFTSKEGNLDWNCYQPISKVNLKIGDTELKGTGYVEKLTLTVSPWKIPMNELRWGRYISNKTQLVWIEIREKEIQQWIWYNGKKIENASIEDNCITLPHLNIYLELDKGIILESEKKILKVVKDLLVYLPGFNKEMSKFFLNSDEYKWLSRGILKESNKTINEGWAIHEFIDFNTIEK